MWRREKGEGRRDERLTILGAQEVAVTLVWVAKMMKKYDDLATGFAAIVGDIEGAGVWINGLKCGSVRLMWSSHRPASRVRLTRGDRPKRMINVDWYATR